MYSIGFLRNRDAVDRPSKPLQAGYVRISRENGDDVLAPESQSMALALADDTDGRMEEERMSYMWRWKQGHFTISPEENPYIETWDSLVILALAMTALVLPFQVALMAQPPRILRKMDLCIDCIFSMDIVLTFNMAFNSFGDKYERAPLKIWKHYCAVPFSDNFTAGWFWPDMMTVIPWDLILGATGNDGAELRLVRILRLARMMRLVRVVKLFRRWHTAWGFPIAYVNVGRCMGSTLLLCHWLACIFAAVALNAEQESWFSFWQTHFGDNKDIADCSVWEIYNTALYFMFSTLTSVGFGDMLPQSQMEILTTSVSMILLGVTWAWVLATIVNVITNADLCSTQANMAMDDLNLLMDSRDLSSSLRRRSRKHLHEAFNVHRLRHQQRTIRWLSAGLQGEIAIESGVDKVCSCIWYLRELTDAVLIDIAQYFIADMFSPNEFILDRFSVSVIRRGTCTWKGRFLMRDAVIGEDFILASDELRDSSCPRTITFVELMSLSRVDLLSVCEKHPDFNRRLRKAQVRLAVWRGFIHLAKLSRKKRLLTSFTKSLRTRSFSSNDGSRDGEERAPMFTSEQIAASLTFRHHGFAESIRAVPLWTGQSDLAKLVDQVSSLKQRVDEGIDVVALGFEEVQRRLDTVDQRTIALEKRSGHLIPRFGFCAKGIG